MGDVEGEDIGGAVGSHQYSCNTFNVIRVERILIGYEGRRKARQRKVKAYNIPMALGSTTRFSKIFKSDNAGSMKAKV